MLIPRKTTAKQKKEKPYSSVRAIGRKAKICQLDTHRSDLEEVHCGNNDRKENQSYENPDPSGIAASSICKYCL